MQDDASSKMTTADYAMFDKLGAQTVILKEPFRSSYALVGYTGPGRPSWIKQVRNCICNGTTQFDLFQR